MEQKQRTNPPAIEAGYQHGEAFCRMKYRDEVTGQIELIWNSRDGVTPFFVRSRAGNPAQHVNWHEDVFVPRYVPQIGERIFVDLTEERARHFAREKVEHFWDHPEYPLRKRYASKEQAVEEFTKDMLRNQGEPNLIEVTAEVLTQVLGHELQTCPRRVHEYGPWKQDEKLDVWRREPNGDRTCSFCGSLHPEDFEQLCEEAADPDTETRLEHSDKQYKVYVYRPGVKNAMDGGIKYYKQHSPEDPLWKLRVEPKFMRALDISRVKFERWMESFRRTRPGRPDQEVR